MSASSGLCISATRSKASTDLCSSQSIANTAPSSPLATAARSPLSAGWKRWFCITASRRPWAAASAIRSRPAATDPASGFSQITSQPPANAASATTRRLDGGVRSTTIRGWKRPIAAATSVSAGASTPNSRRIASAFALSMSTRAQSSNPGSCATTGSQSRHTLPAPTRITGVLTRPRTTRAATRCSRPAAGSPRPAAWPSPRRFRSPGAPRGCGRRDTSRGRG